jgi:hypothetical protein
MSDHEPRLDDLVEGLDSGERARLERVHHLLVEAGPPPELSPALAVAPPEPPVAPVVPLLRRYRFAAVAVAIVAALTLLGAGYLLGGGGGDDARVVERTVVMSGPGGATGALDVFAKDAAGNWPMELAVSGLPELAAGETYELWLTRDGELADACGSFRVHAGTTTVPLNAPYRLNAFSGWVVVVSGSDERVLRTESV